MYLPMNLTNTLVNASLAILAPDFVVCNDWYQAPRLSSDCKRAIDRLPDDPKPIPWANWVGPPRVRHPLNLPLVVFYGDCQVKLDLSGPTSPISSLGPYLLSGTDVRAMANAVKGRCIDGSHTGGFVTKGLANTIDYVTDSKTVYSDDIPPSTAYFTLTIWDADASRPNIPFNPGNNDPEVGEAISDHLYAEWTSLANSVKVKTVLENRWKYISRTVARMSREPPWCNWWDATRPALGGLGVENESLEA